MIDVDKHVAYWRNSALEDHKTFLARFDIYQLEGRYAAFTTTAPTLKEARQELNLSLLTSSLSHWYSR
jgi:hypothetical protein